MTINLKKLQLIGAILAILAGIVFVVFAVFFNHATLEISAQGPFEFNIEGIRSETCSGTICSTVLAPGTYRISLSKAGYLNITDQVELKRNQTTSKTYQFQKQPQVQLMGVWNPPNTNLSENFLSLDLPVNGSLWTSLADLFSVTPQNFEISPDGSSIIFDDGKTIKIFLLGKNQSADLPFPSGSPFAYVNSQKIIFLSDNTDGNQSLFTLDLASSPWNSLALTSFGRKISRARIIAQPGLAKIALIDQSDPKNTGLYIIDNQTHTRNNFDQSPVIMDLKWLSDSTFLVQKRNPVSFINELYFGDLNKPGLQLLDFHQNLPAVFPLDADSILLAQSLSSVSDSADPTQLAGGFILEKINLSQPDNPATVYTVADLQSPDKIQYDRTQKTIYFLSAGNLYSLNLEVK